MISFSNARLRTKLLLASVVCASFALLIGSVGWYGVRKMGDALSYTGAVEEAARDLIARQVDHQLWVRNAGTFLLDESVSKLDVETDYHKCRLGTWYYGEGRRELEKAVPALHDKVAALEAPHRELHESARLLETMLSEGREARSEAVSFYARDIAEKLKKTQGVLDAIVFDVVAESKQTRIQSEKKAAGLRLLTLSTMVVSTILFVFVGIMLSRFITKPMNRVALMLQDIAEGNGDLTKRVEASFQDEIGEMVRWFNLFVEKLQGMMREIATLTSTLSVSSEELSAVSAQVAANAQQMNNQTQTVAQSTELAAANTTNISVAAEEMSASIRTVAAAIEQMSASLLEINKSCQRESDYSSKASIQARETQKTMERLGESAREVGKIVDLISDIAEQTNLLALNAAIEAASAGDAGRGFAVVANAIKDLARQSAGATEEIRAQIENMQGNTSAAVNAMSQISTVINEITKTSQTIVAAVDQQSATINELARNMGGANQAATDIARNVAESAAGLQAVAGNVNAIGKAVSENSSSASRLKTSSGDLASMTAVLGRLVGQFRT